MKNIHNLKASEICGCGDVLFIYPFSQNRVMSIRNFITHNTKWSENENKPYGYAIYSTLISTLRHWKNK